MWRTRFLIAALVASALHAAWGAGSRGHSTGFPSFDRGMYRLAVTDVRRALADNPDSPDLHAILAVSLVELGRLGEAAPEIEFAWGNSLDEALFIGARADVLRVTGDPVGAAALRAERLVSEDTDDGEMLIYVAMADDLRVAGDFGAAEDAALRAIAAAPNAPSGHYALADVYVDMGDVAAAEEECWVASLRGGRTLRGRITEARVLLAAGDPDGAEHVLTDGLRGPLRSWRMAILRAAVARAEGRSEEAEHWLYSQLFGVGEWPELLAMRAVIAADAGRVAEARELVDRVAALYPDFPDVQYALAWIERAERAAP